MGFPLIVILIYTLAALFVVAGVYALGHRFFAGNYPWEDEHRCAC